MEQPSQREEELRDALEDVTGQLQDAADTIQKITELVMPGYFSKDAEAYRETTRKASQLL
jgi:hypothetical protein